MKAMMAGFAFAIVVSIGAYFVLGEMGFSAEDTYSGTSVRLD